MSEEVSTRRLGALRDVALWKLIGRFLAYFSVMLIGVEWLAGRTPLMAELQVATVDAATALMRASGVAASASGHYILMPGRQLLIGPDCTALRIVALLVSMVLAYPVRFSSKAIGLLLGVSIVIVTNLLRLAAMGHISRVPDVPFTIAHDFFFQAGMVIVVVGVWAGWLSLARARES